MKTRESALWGWLSRGLKDLPRCHVVRVENGAETGTPDIEGCLDGVQFWLELKVATISKKGVIHVNITPDQVMWLRARVRAGGNAFLLIRVGRLHFLLKGDCDLLPYMVGENISFDELYEWCLIGSICQAIDIFDHVSG